MFKKWLKDLNERLSVPTGLVLMLLAVWILLRPDTANIALTFGIMVLGTLAVSVPIFTYFAYKLDVLFNKKKNE